MSFDEDARTLDKLSLDMFKDSIFIQECGRKIT